MTSKDQLNQQDQFSQEQAHLAQTIDWVKKERERIANLEENLQEEIRQLRKGITHLADERLLTKQLLQQYAVKDLKIMDYCLAHPYFGRVDFQEKGRDGVEALYIGKHGLHDKEQEVPVVIDWRAPIADIYYSSLSQEVAYRAPQGEIQGRLFLKRRYEIQDGTLENYYDQASSENQIESSLNQDDDFLIGALSKSNQGRLKEIVATIQDQQNKVIRSTSLKPLVVQGVAGGGKTTIALHRMAYLIYHNRRNLHQANYLVIAPNRLFLNYISDILPDLGVDNVTQTTFEDWALGLIGKKLNFRPQTDQLNRLLTAAEQEASLLSLAAQIKGSLRFKKILDQELLQLANQMLPQEDLKLGELSLLDAESISRVFATSNLHLCLSERVAKLKIYLKNKLKNDLPDLYERLDKLYQVKLNRLKATVSDLETIRPEIIALYNQRDAKKKSLKKELPAAVEAYLRLSAKPNIFTLYAAIFEGSLFASAFQTAVGEARFTELKAHFLTRLAENQYDNEDLAPLAYLKIKLFGFEEKLKYTHVVVDEAQDFDEFKLSILREITLFDSFTLVGDLSQGIYSYKGIQDWDQTMKRVFGQEQYQYFVLTTSYRSTVEIVELANHIIAACPGFHPVLAEPVFRHGQLPRLIQTANQQEMAARMAVDMQALFQHAAPSLAIICANQSEAQTAYQAVKKHLPQISLLTERTTDLKNGVVVVPAHLAKGLEFDGVFLWNVSADQYKLTPIHTKLLFVGATRALHLLHFYYSGKPSRILSGFPPTVLSQEEYPRLE